MQFSKALVLSGVGENENVQILIPMKMGHFENVNENRIQ